ncbi:MAG: hypothetical protein ACKOKB_03920, partial [Bacteroidota bacterium]
ATPPGRPILRFAPFVDKLPADRLKRSLIMKNNYNRRYMGSISANWYWQLVLQLLLTFITTLLHRFPM